MWLFKKRELKTKYKNSALCLNEKLVSFYTLRSIHKTVTCKLLTTTKKKIGYIDESGDKSIHFEKEGVSTFFIVSAIIIDESLVDNVRNQFLKIHKDFTQAPEIKSNAKAFQKGDKRIKFLKEIIKLNFRIYSVIVDKRKIYEDSGLQFRDSFYKYTNNLLDKELYDYYPHLELISDQHGSEKFMNGFIKYVKENHRQTEFFRNPEFRFCDSKDEPLIQLADFVAGSIAKCYEPDKINSQSPEILNILDKHILHLREWPETPPKFYKEIKKEEEKYNKKLVVFIFSRIIQFLSENEDTTNTEIKNQLT
ncbi:DUF3800 domain-containing protein [Tenacibaculum mesophilum]|uniref:DUF3800 domain-containing protein n=1 Tax=Tenacibaculum mesophilum TaxID=104268 RepID=A0ABM7CCT3_9FLAO|nr:DUF3800 domain-containing protein [Tenacibaculum mesophilum]QFS29578.1 DUF3800 domain-containing protein [Tenacibaculum mesophilum]